MKKYHKLHRHKDATHKHSSKSKHRHKQKKEKPVSESVLEPIKEISNEKVKIDKNACGDYVVSQFQNDPKKISKHRREKREKIGKTEKLDEEQVDIFAKNYLRKLKESTDERLVRHQSLEKSGDSLINKTKNLFRREKSFDDAVAKVSVDLEVNNREHRHRDRKRRHRSGKNEKDEITKQKREKHQRCEKSSKRSDKEAKEDHVQNKEKRHKKTEKKRAKSSNKSPLEDKHIHSRIHEVIYCQMDQAPYKLKNDKSGAEIKDLYQRIKKENKREKIEEKTTRGMPRVYEEGKKKHDLDKYMNCAPFLGRMDIKNEKKKERSKSRSERVPEKNIQKREERSKSRPREDNTKDKHHKKCRHHDSQGFLKDSAQKPVDRKRRKGSLSNIDLGPYHKYFAFENNDAIEQGHKKVCKEGGEQMSRETRSSKEKKYRENPEQPIKNVDYEHTAFKRHHGAKAEKGQESNSNPKIEEDKIHQIVEGDLKTYFTKIQYMIDKKLDAILQIDKSRQEKTSNTKLKETEHRKRSKSRTIDKKFGNEDQRDNKKEDRSRKTDTTNNGDAKEEIIQEVLRRIKKEEKYKAKLDKEVSTKHESCDLCEKVRKDDSKNSKDFKEVSKTCKKCQKMLDNRKKSPSKTPDVGVIQESYCKKHRESGKDLEHKGLSSSRQTLCIQHKEAKKFQDNGYNKEKGPSRQIEDRKGPREPPSPENICQVNNNPHEAVSSQKRSDNKQWSHEKRSLPKDSLEYIKNRGSPSPELVVPAVDISRVEWEAYLKSKRRYRNPYTGGISLKEDLSHHSLRKHYTSASSCRACSEQHRVATQTSKKAVLREHCERNVVCDEIDMERCNVEKTLSHRRSDKIHRVKKNYISHNRNDITLSTGHEAHSPRDPVMVMAPRGHKKRKVKSDSRRLPHDVLVQYTDPNFEHIILPPEMFRTPGVRLVDHRGEQIYYQDHVKSPEMQHLRQEFVVQGIEPPILECSRQKSTVQIRTRNLECKTVSIVGIPPQVRPRDMLTTNVTQTSSKSQKSTIRDGDIVEKRKQSKRFKLYYKYSVVNNCNEEKDSDAKSIVSDSCRVISDPSEEERATVCYARDVKIKRERQVASEVSQVLNVTPKKWVPTLRDLQLKNIIEEPSNISNSVKDDDYFIPIGDTKQCYFRALTSSHSEYCFKINKKPANSNVSILSKDACEGRYRYYEDGRCRHCKRSKSDVNLVSNCHGIQIFRSRSDVFLSGASDKKVIKSIFLEDSHTHVRSKRVAACFTENYAPPNVYKGRDIIKTVGKVCQTSDVRVNYDVPVDEDGNELVIEDKERQFKDIYKTIDDLEENIHSSRRTPPHTLDIAVSSRFMSLDKLSDKKPQFKEIYRIIETLQNKVRDTSDNQLVKKIDVAIGSPIIKTHRSQRGSRSEPRRKTHEVAVGDSKNQVSVKVRTPGYKSESTAKRLKSTGVSPIRIIEDLQNSARSPARQMTPISPNIRTNVTRPSPQKPSRNVQDDISRKTVNKVAETKREPISLRPKIVVVKNTKIKSPDRTETANKNSKRVDGLQPVQGIRVMRSKEISAGLKRREKPVENITNTTETSPVYQKEKSDLIQSHCDNVQESEDVKPISTDPSNNLISSKQAARKCPSHEKGDELKKTPLASVKQTCVHHYHPRDLNVQQSSRTTGFLTKTPTGTPVTVNTALLKSSPICRQKVIPSTGSTSSSLGDDSSENLRQNSSLAEIRVRKNQVNRSKSEIISVDNALVICNSRDFETNGGSVISGNMEKYTNVPRLRCPSSKSSVHSLDKIIGQKFGSRLLLTKDYKGGEISAYQRRKLYDQTVRQRMKKKFRFSKMEVGPQIFEVRFLSMVSQENTQRKEKETRVKHYLDRPLINLNLEKAKTEGNFCQRKIQNSIIVKDEGNVIRCKDEELTNNTNDISNKCNIINNKIPDCCILTENKLTTKGQSSSNVQGHQDDINQKNDILKNIKTSGNQSIVEVYFKDQKVNEEKLLSFCNKLLNVNSSLEFPEEFKGVQCTCTKFSENCQSCKHFVNLMDMLCSSVATYCDSKTKLVSFNWKDNCNVLENSEQSDRNIKKGIAVNKYDTKGEFDKLHDQLPNLEVQQAYKTVQEIFSRSGNNSSGESNESTDQSDKIFRNIVDSVSLANTNGTDNVLSWPQPLSCPVLATNTSSFEFLYEETSSSDNQAISREIVFANLTRPFDQSFNISMSQYNVETPFFRRSNRCSPTGSSESGYESFRSKSYREHSVTNFFKKPDIAALLKPPVLQRRNSDLTKFYEQKDQGDLKKNMLYEKMTKSCQLYAKKVRESSELKLIGNVDEYQEFPLAFLLGKNSSMVLKSTAISQRSSIRSFVAFNVCNEDADTKKIVQLDPNNEDDRPFDTDDKNDLFKIFKIPFAENGCKLILKNEYLKTDSVTYLGPEIFNSNQEFTSSKASAESQKHLVDDNSKRDHDSTILVDVDSTFTLDISLDSNNPFLPSKDVLTQKFFGSLLKIYEKEMELSNELFKNDEFLKNVLLPAVKEKINKDKRSRKGRFSRFFKRKIPADCLVSERNKYKFPVGLQAEASTKLQSLASNAKKCFTMLAEAVKANENIDDEIKICGLLKMLERIEIGDFYLIKNDEDSNLEQDFQSQIKDAFINIYEICEREAKNAKRIIGDQEINLIKAFVSKYKIGLLSKTDIVACHIGRGMIKTEAQLKAAVTYLMRAQPNGVNIKEFEKYCNFTKSIQK